LAALAVEGGRFLVPAPPMSVGKPCRLRILAGDVSLAREAQHQTTILNILPVRLLKAASLGEHEVIVVLGLGIEGTGARVLARITQRSWDVLALAEGANVFAQIKAVALASGP